MAVSVALAATLLTGTTPGSFGFGARLAAADGPDQKTARANAGSAGSQGAKLSPDERRPTQEAPRRTLTLALGGDVMFGRFAPEGWRSHGGAEPFGDWKAILAKADVALINLETGVCERGRQNSRLPLLWAPPSRLARLVDAGVDVVSVANNHALDCGPNGLLTTRRELERRGLAVAGVAPSGAVAVGPDVLVFAATFHAAPYRSSGPRPVEFPEPTPGHDEPIENLVGRVEALHRTHPDRLLVISLHWGLERSPVVAPWQRDLGRRLVAAGAHVVVGHGSHTPGPREYWHGGVILYGLGNLVFDDRTQIGHPVPPIVVRFAKHDETWELEP